MTIQSNAPQDARRRTDDFEREFVATAGGTGPSPSSGHGNGKVTNASHELLHQLERSAQSLRHTAESVENRGLKLLLKVIAQERVSTYNALRQALGQGVSDPLDSANKSPATNLHQGLQDIQTSMTVQRQGRENVALTHFVEEEGALLAAYAAALEEGVASPLRSEVESQQARVAQFYARLQSVGAGIEPIVARVFDTRAEGESAVTRLREQGLDASLIDVVPIPQLAQPRLGAPERPAVKTAGPKSTMAAGAFSGAIVGGLVGLALAAFVWLSPQLIGWVTVGPGALLIGAILIGVVFGTVFGFFIGQSQREDDLAVTADSLVNGEILVAAYPQPQQVAMVEDVLQVHHARELSR